MDAPARAVSQRSCPAKEKKKNRRLNVQTVSAAAEFLACNDIKLWEQAVLNFIHMEFLSVTTLFKRLDGNDFHPVSTVDVLKCCILGCHPACMTGLFLSSDMRGWGGEALCEKY